MLQKTQTPPVEVLAELAKDEDNNVRRGVAYNPSAPAEALKLLAGDTNEPIRRGVAKNPNTPIEVLAELAKDKYNNVRCGVAGNPNAPIEVLAELAVDEDIDVRRDVACNPNTPVEVLVKLAEDEHVRSSVAGNPNTPKETLIELAKYEERYVRIAIAKNPNTPVEALVKLAEDEDPIVLRYLVKNPNTPPDALIKDESKITVFARFPTEIEIKNGVLFDGFAVTENSVIYRKSEEPLSMELVGSHMFEYYRTVYDDVALSKDEFVEKFGVLPDKEMSEYDTKSANAIANGSMYDGNTSVKNSGFNKLVVDSVEKVVSPGQTKFDESCQATKRPTNAYLVTPENTEKITTAIENKDITISSIGEISKGNKNFKNVDYEYRLVEGIMFSKAATQALTPEGEKLLQSLEQNNSVFCAEIMKNEELPSIVSQKMENTPSKKRKK